MDSSELLLEWCRFGWKYRGVGKLPKEEQDWYAERVRYELNMITEKDFSDVFLVVSDAIRWAKDNGIAVGPGRGSVAASVVAWLLRIHEIDPYRHPGLLFERFLDSTRADPPDIDTDFEDDRRAEVRAYLEKKYGRECVGQVGNFIRYRGKNALVDVARVYQVPVAAKEIVSNLIVERSGGDSRFDASLEDTVAMFPNAKNVFDNFPDLWKATRLEGNVRGMSVHAAGLVVANTPITDFCAIYERNGVQVMSIDKHDVEYVDAIKLDFLGLTTMSIISRCLALTGLTLDDLYSIPLDDEETLEGFRQVDVVGVFQFEGRATRLVCRDVLPRNFTELADINALSRPGPLFSGTTATYVHVRHGRQEAEKLHPIVDEITAQTKGQIIYQEQILQVLQRIGGLDWFNIHHIRRIIAKKAGEAAFQMSWGTFRDGAKRLHNMDEKLSDKIWKLLVTSGTYAFVTAHAVSYTLLGWWCMWLKMHYPLEFYAASLSKTGDAEQAYKLMRDAEAHDLEISPPKLNISRASWIPHEGQLVAGWRQIPGIGEKMAERIDMAHNSFSEWEHMLGVPGIGPKKIETIRAFSEASDPFGLRRTGIVLGRVERWLKKQDIIPYPTHDGLQLASIKVQEWDGTQAKKNYGKGPRVIYCGIVKTVNYQDAVENRRSRTGEEAEDILRSMKRPDLLAYCSIRCYDRTDEEVYLRVNRFKFPELKRRLEGIQQGHDVVVVVGSRISGFGTPVMVDKLFVIDPE